MAGKDEQGFIASSLSIFKDSSTPETIHDFYKQWAAQYDKTMKDSGYQVAPDLVAALLRHLEASAKDKDIIILDIGCGTGAVGRLLKHRGYHLIDGLDFSQEMLDIAIRDCVYRKTYCLRVGADELPIKADSYDVITAAAAIGGGHIKPEAFDEIRRLVKPGGLMLLQMEGKEPYISKLMEMEKAGRVAIVAKEPIGFLLLPGKAEVEKTQLIILKKL